MESMTARSVVEPTEDGEIYFDLDIKPFGSRVAVSGERRAIV